MIRQSFGAVAVGTVSFAVAVACALVLAGAGWFKAYWWAVYVAPPEPVPRPLALLAAGVLVGPLLCVLFGSAALLSARLRIPHWPSIAVAGVVGGAGLHWLLIWLTLANYYGFGVTFPYWRMELEIHFG